MVAQFSGHDFGRNSISAKLFRILLFFSLKYVLQGDAEVNSKSAWRSIIWMIIEIETWHLILKMQIVSTNRAWAMKIHPELFCIMIYQSRFSAMWLTQILNLVGDIESNPGLPHVCEMRRMWRLVLVHMHRNTNTYKSLTQATIHWTTQTKTYAYNKLTSTASATNMNSLSNLHTLHYTTTLHETQITTPSNTHTFALVELKS